VHEECTGTRKVVHPSVHQPNIGIGKQGSTWDNGDTRLCHMGQVLIKMEGQFEISRKKVP
jgi:hypothetical protein